LKEQWPALYKDFRHFCKTEAPKAGDIWAWKGPGTPVIYSLFTQDAAEREGSHPPKATMQNLNHALKNLVKDLTEQKIQTLAITRISTGVGGLEFSEVKAMVQKDLEAYDGKVFFYTTYRANVMATEKDSCCGVCS